MAGFLDKEEIEFPCENCSCKTKKTIAWLNTNNKFICACGTEIIINADQLKTNVAKIEKAISDMERSLKNLGRKG